MLYLICPHEGGEVVIKATSVEDLAEHECDADRWVESKEIDGDGPDMADGCWRGHILIRGRIVVPKPKTVITEYEVE